MRDIIKTKELSRGYKVVLVQTQSENEKIGYMSKYDVELQNNNGRVITVMSSECMGEDSGKYWLKEGVKYMQRFLLLTEDRDMAYNNKFCYSKNLLMDTPKEGYEYEWEFESERANMLEEWLVELSNYWGKRSSKGEDIRREFDVHDYLVKGYK